MHLYEDVIIAIRSGNVPAAIDYYQRITKCTHEEATKIVTDRSVKYEQEKRLHKRFAVLPEVNKFIKSFGYQTHLNDAVYAAYYRAYILSQLGYTVTKELIERELSMTKARLEREAKEKANG
jgi:hypothetical protein